MKGFSGELMSLFTVLAIPASIALVFPYGAVGFVPRPDVKAKPSSAAFVELTDEVQALAMRSAKTSWQGDAGGVRSLRADLSVGELPEDPAAVSMDIGVTPSRSTARPVDYSPAAYPSALAAPPAARLVREEGEPERPLPFPKSELLKID